MKPTPIPEVRTGVQGALRHAPALILVLVALVYANSLKVPFLLDDLGSIVNNPTIRKLWPPWEALSPPTGSGETVAGRPLLNLSFALNHAISGLETWTYHAVNIAIHGLAALVLFGLSRRLLRLSRGAAGSGMTALGIALLWALHPLQTESVTYVVQRAESLVGLFYLLTLLAFVRSLDAPGAMRWQGVAVSCCLLGMASKEVMATAPLAVLLLDRTFGAGSFVGALRGRPCFYASLAATWLLLAWLVVGTGNRGGTAGAGAELEWWAYALTQCRAVLLYLRLALWPSPLVFDYGIGVVRDPGEVAIHAVVLLTLVAGTVYALWRWPRAGFVAAMFFLILGPTSSVIPVVTQTMAEHRMYLPLAAVSAGMVLLAERCLGGRAWLAVAPAVLALAGTSVARNQVYRDELRLWSDSVAKYPGSARAQNNLGAILVSAGRDEEAEAHFREAIRLRPDYLRALSNQGALLMRQGRVAEGLEVYGRILQVRSDFEGRYSYARMLEGAGRGAEALPHYEEAVRLGPDSAEARLALANLLVRLDRAPESLAHYEHVERIRPGEAVAFGNHASALASMGRLREAVPLYERALELQPASRARLGLALALGQLGDTAGALAQLREAVQHAPNDPELRTRLADALRAAGRIGEANVEMQRAATLRNAGATGQ